jgi:hypothetical protein
MTRQFWHNDITDKSFSALAELNKNFHFILIGGWAVYLWSKKMKSKDIDIVLDFSELGKIKEKYNIKKNDRLKKYEADLGEFDIDIYLPHYSRIGFPLEELDNYTHNLEGFRVPQIEVLLFLKLYAFRERKNSLKGEKDKLDIIGLAQAVDIDWEKFKKLCDSYGQNLIPVLRSVFDRVDRVKELDINNSEMAKLKKEILNNLT